ncbi:MAG: MBL fold metallo-hydrolase [Bryobacteraceae bacterium]
MPLSLMEEIRAFRTPPGRVAIWWLGQMGYIFKSPSGTTLGVDLYLTDSCAGLERPLDLSRRAPVLIEPEELELDVFACTHNHRDHTDPETIARLRRKEAMWFVGPPPSCEVFGRQGVPDSRIRMLWAGAALEHGELRLRATFALPTEASDLNHLGYVIRFGEGPVVYLTGDTAWHELVAEAAPQAPDILITCINGGFANLSHWEAAGLAARIRPKVAIPCHYDLFPDNSADPRQFRAALMVRASGVRYQELEHGEVWVYPEP